MDECKPLNVGYALRGITMEYLSHLKNPPSGDRMTMVMGTAGLACFTAGAHTRPLFSSTRAVSGTKYTPHIPCHPLTPPAHRPLMIPTCTPYPRESAYFEPKSGRVKSPCFTAYSLVLTAPQFQDLVLAPMRAATASSGTTWIVLLYGSHMLSRGLASKTIMLLVVRGRGLLSSTS